MTVQTQIDDYIAAQPEPKRADMERLHRLISGTLPGCRLWFLDGRNAEGKAVTNPDIGYGATLIKYADGSTRDFYRVGLSATKNGLSVYIMGLADRTYLPRTYGARLGKAQVTGYCIRFKRMSDIELSVLEELVADQLGMGSA